MEEGRRAGALEALLQHEAVAAAVVAGAALGGDRGEGRQRAAALLRDDGSHERDNPPGAY
jgi:hypothetical protein